MRIDDVHCRESAGTGPVVLKVVRMTDAAFSGVPMDQLMGASLSPHSLSEVCVCIKKKLNAAKSPEHSKV